MIGKIFLILFSSLILFSCDQTERVKSVDGHVYLRRDGGNEFHHDPNCGRCKEIQLGISREHAIEIKND